jgi:hypothetical protein
MSTGDPSRRRVDVEPTKLHRPFDPSVGVTGPDGAVAQVSVARS